MGEIEIIGLTARDHGFSFIREQEGNFMIEKSYTYSSDDIKGNDFKVGNVGAD